MQNHTLSNNLFPRNKWFDLKGTHKKFDNFQFDAIFLDLHVRFRYLTIFSPKS